MTWTDEKIETLKQLHADGLSFSHIASEIGVTRNAAIGKARRIGLIGKRKAARRKLDAPKVRKAAQQHPGNIRRKARARKREARKPVPAVIAPSPSAPPQPSNASPTPFDRLGPGQCRWCIEPPMSPAGPAMMCCGAPVVDRYAPAGKRERTHCEYHLKIGGRRA